MPHDIIDNQSIKLADSIRSMLPRSEVAHFAVGYFFLSRLEAVADVLMPWPASCINSVSLAMVQ